MREKFIKIANTKIFIIVLVLILISITLLVGTYAWFTWSSTDNTSFTMSIGNIADIEFEGGNQIDDRLSPVFNYTDGLSTSFNITKKTRGYIKYNVYLNITTIASELISEEVKYLLIKDEEVVAEGNLSTAGDGTSITLYSGTLGQGTSSYVFYLYIDGNVENDLSMMNKTIVGSITISAEELSSISLIQHIKNLYTSGTPELITQETSGDSYYYSYQDADKKWGLMNDGLTIDTSQNETTTGLAKVVTGTTALTTGAEGNIRYFGPSDKVNNYIYFNCNDYSNQGLTDANGNKNCELWRIIGIVDGKVKIIKNDSIGNLAWDQDKNQNSSLTTYSNNWKTSSLQLFLNGLYYNRGTTESHIYLSGINGTPTTTLDLITIGITESTRTNNLISEEVWYLGGYKNSNVYPNDIYTYERTNTEGTTILSGFPFTINANIGLMYMSDYSYGTDLSKCSSQLSEVNITCRTNNWLFNNSSQWLINSYPSDSEHAWLLDPSGVANSVNYVYNAYYGVHPVLYLNSELVIETETEGTSAEPYKISVS